MLRRGPGLYYDWHDVTVLLWHSSVSRDSIKKPWEDDGGGYSCATEAQNAMEDGSFVL